MPSERHDLTLRKIEPKFVGFALQADIAEILRQCLTISKIRKGTVSHQRRGVELVGINNVNQIVKKYTKHQVT